MQRAELEAAVLEYEVSGDGDPVLFIHGACIADAFRPLGEQPTLSTNFRLITYRRRGYGGSTRPAGRIGLGDQAADCLGLLRYLDVDRAHVVGHSFGGSIALQLAMDAPETVHSLALLEPALAVGGSGQAYRESLQRGIQRYQEVGAAAAVDEMLIARWPDYRAQLDQIQAGAFDQAVTDAAASFETELPALLDWSFTIEDAKGIARPVLSVIGDASLSLSPRFMEVHNWLLGSMQTVGGYVLPRAHHFLQMENPSDMAEELTAFFRRYPFRV